ncbi:hypothetical protein [Arcobacter sp. LA11]|uniref:hypothetical protein n=1 Tax=Arcobacter sp. LA11 TaxID=1898176 RepID=UPI0009322634|nr:hypothetical protein [Arcobacter sp. LA11]
MQEKKPLSPLQLNELKNFMKENSSFVYEYINSEVLKDIGIMNKDYFSKVIQNIFNEETDIEKINPNILPYFIFTLLFDKGKVDYTSLRVETINFKQINKEASTYYNYVQFSLKNDSLHIELIQSKIGGMPIDKDIVKFTKIVPIKNTGLEEFINKELN